jgi:DNA-binding transcriptional LysR family regulator
MDILAAMRVFHAVVEAGSFAAAADKLDLSRGMATKYVAALEKQLGARLLYRTTRKLALTEAGTDYASRVAAILAQVDEAAAAVSSQSLEPAGTIRLTASVDFGQRRLGRLLAEFRRRYPRVAVDLTLANKHIDLIEEGYDLALWTTLQPGDENLVARPLGRTFQHTLLAAPSYLAEHGTPRTPADLARHNCLHYSRRLTPNVWAFGPPEDPVRVTVSGSLSANNSTVLIDAARAGLGIVLQPLVLVQDDLASGRLVELLPEWEKPNFSLNAFYPARRYLPQKVRVLIDFLAEQLAQARPETGPAMVESRP